VALGLTDVTVGVVAVTIVAVAVAVTDLSATEVAVIVTTLGEGTVPGAVYLAVFGLLGSGTVMVPIPVSVVESDQVTFSHVGLEARIHPGLFTVAVNEKCSVVPTVAVDGAIVMLIPVMMVTAALEVLEVSACDVAVIVAVGAMVVVPLDVVVGRVAGAVKVAGLEPVVLVGLIVPHVPAVTPLAQVTDQLTVVLLEPVTKAEKF